MTAEIICGDCGARVPAGDGPTHRYLGAVAGCWTAYNSLLLRQYSDPVGYGAGQQLTVDAYAAQHPGVPGPQASQSVAGHLVGLCLVLERGWAAGTTIPPMRQFLTAHKGAIAWLAPPPSRGALTILDVLAAPTPAAYQEAVRAWATDIWTAWAAVHGAQLRAWAAEVG